MDSGIVDLSEGNVAPECVADLTEQLAPLLAKALQDRTICQYVASHGLEHLRLAIAKVMASHRELHRDERVLISNGSLQALSLMARHVARSDRYVMVQRPTYYKALTILRQSKCPIVSCDASENGLSLDEVERHVAAHGPPALIYVIGRFHNPTGISIDKETRKGLLDLAMRHEETYVVEDDAYGEIYFDDCPPSLFADATPNDRMIYLGSFSKTLFPGLRLGWLIGRADLVSELCALKEDTGSSPLTSAAIAYYVYTRGVYNEHLTRIRSTYRARRNALSQALTRHCSSTCTWRVPEGGFYVWLNTHRAMSQRDWKAVESQLGVKVFPGERCVADNGVSQHARLSFSCSPVELFEDGAARLAAAVKTR